MLVTGHKGYIGSHLMKQIGGMVTVCDLKDGDDYADFRGDWPCVVHLASSVSVADSFLHPEEYFANNVFKLARFLENSTVEHFIFTSTGGALYGNARLAKEQDSDWSKCLSPYAQSKYLAEELIRRKCKSYTILRLGNVFGGDYSVRGEASVHAHFESDDPITVYGGWQTRDFVHIDTVCQAILNACEKRPQGTFNIGSGEEKAVSSIAMQAVLERQVSIRKEPMRNGEVEFISLDISRAQRNGLLA